jgi:uncharacterized Rmd1/YagE family protein
MAYKDNVQSPTQRVPFKPWNIIKWLNRQIVWGLQSCRFHSEIWGQESSYTLQKNRIISYTNAKTYNLNQLYSSLQSNCTILQSNLSHVHSLLFNSQVISSHCFKHTRELHAKIVSKYKSGNSSHVPSECTTQACLECEDKHKKLSRQQCSL